MRKTEAREARNKSTLIIAFGGKMAPQITPGGLCLAFGGVLARQEQAEGPKGEKKRPRTTQDRPKSAKKPF